MPRAEAERVGVPLERPSRWMLAREEREYHLADQIFVLSEFARRSFIDCGVASGKVRTNPLGVDVTHFKSSDAVRSACQTRILSNAPLRVLRQYLGRIETTLTSMGDPALGPKAEDLRKQLVTAANVMKEELEKLKREHAADAVA